MRKFLLVSMVLLALAGAGAWGWLWLQKPALDRLPRPGGAGEVVERSRLAVGGRRYFRMALDFPNLPPVRLSVSYPARLQNPRPALVLIGPPAEGRELLARLRDHGPNVLVAVDWPVSGRLPGGPSGWLGLPGLVENSYAMPGQLAGAVRWLARQDYVKSDQISLAGLSLGSRMVPAARRMARQAGQPPAAAAMTVAGPSLAQGLGRGGVGRAVLQTALRPVGPAAHVGAMRGPSLLIAGPGGLQGDPQARTFAATPPPRTVVQAGGPGGVGRSEALRLTRTWLARRGLLAERSPLEGLD